MKYTYRSRKGINPNHQRKPNQDNAILIPKIGIQ